MMNKSFSLSRRTLLLGSLATSGLVLLKEKPIFISAAMANSEIIPSKPSPKRFFAFDTGIYHGNKMQNMQLKMGDIQKEKNNPLFIEGLYETPAKPWEPRIDNGYPNVILDENGLYRCYYTLFVIDPSSTNTPREQRQNTPYQTKGREVGLAYAESKDGINWYKPNLGLVEFNGSKENNLIMRDVAGTGILFEPNDPDPNKRYKLITRKEKGNQPLAIAFSADGIHFSPLQEWAENSPRLGADCHNAVFKDPRTNEYILTSRLWANNLRVVALSRSKDFIHWSPLEEVARGNGYEEQLYSMPVFEYQHIYFGFASVYRQGDNTHPEFDTLNLELYWSNNLTEWNKIVPNDNIFIPTGAGRNKFTDGEFDSATMFASPTLLNGNRLYYTGGKGRHRSWRETGLGLAYVDKDRFAGMIARNPNQPMKFTTQSFRFLTESIQLFADIPNLDDFSIEIEGQAGFEAQNAQLNEIAKGVYEVHWKDQSLVNLTAEKKYPLSLTFNGGTFWGLQGEMEMDESRIWKG